MQERHHVKTTPGEMKAPEIVPHPVRKEDGHDVQTDDINIPMVAIFVAFFGVLLAVVIIALQAWFYGVQASERAQKLAAQESPNTALGSLLVTQRAELLSGPASIRKTGASATAAATQNTRSVPIADAMKMVENRYSRTGGSQGGR